MRHGDGHLLGRGDVVNVVVRHDYFDRFATSSSVAKSATFRVNLISSAETIFPVYSMRMSLPWNFSISTNVTVSLSTLPSVIGPSPRFDFASPVRTESFTTNSYV